MDRSEKNDLKIKVALEADAKEIHGLMVKVHSMLQDKTLYVCDDLEYIEETIRKKGFVLVACSVSGEIVACFMIRYPGSDLDNLGRDVGIEDSKLDEVVHMESVAVLPEYRGNHLQEKMLCYAQELIDKKKYHYFMATVSPDNPASYRSFEACGYSLIKTKEKYGGLLRRIYQKQV